MDITPPVAADRQLIQGYGDGGFRISGVRYKGPALVLPGQTMACFAPRIQGNTGLS